jgi:hypothetical protein
MMPSLARPLYGQVLQPLAVELQTSGGPEVMQPGLQLTLKA